MNNDINYNIFPLMILIGEYLDYLNINNRHNKGILYDETTISTMKHILNMIEDTIEIDMKRAIAIVKSCRRYVKKYHNISNFEMMMIITYKNRTGLRRCVKKTPN